MLMTLITLAGGLALLNYGAEGLVNGAASLARRLGISHLVIGLTVVAFGTSAPEFVVSLLAAMDDKAGIAIGNIVGSNIANIALILGLSAVISPLRVIQKILRRWFPFLVGITILLAIFVWNGEVSVLEGCVLLLLAVLYTAYAIRAARQGDPSLPDHSDELPETNGSIAKEVVFLVGGIALLVIGSRLTLDGAVELMHMFGLSETVVGLTVIAIGTSLPELATSIVSAMKGHTDITIGNVLGSNVFNTLFVLGGVSLFGAITFEPALINIQMGILLFLTLLLYPMLKSSERVDKWEGAILLACYTGFVAFLFLVD